MVDEKLYYTIGEVADILATTTSQLRYWSGEFELNVRKNRKGDRLFQKADLTKLKLIQRLLKDEGYTIDGAKKKLKSTPKADYDSIESIIKVDLGKNFPAQKPETSDILFKLKSIRNNLANLRSELDN
jgi:DNA-binding transcriptional MerR regulator